MKLKKISWIVLLFWQNLWADARELLEERIEAMDNFQVNFVQQTKGEKLQGIMRLRKPEDFWWEILTPYPLINVLHGQELINYDPELQQAVKSTLVDSSVPARLLISPRVFLQQFQVEVTEGKRGQIFTLYPVQKEDFAQLQIIFKDEVLISIIFEDSFHQRTSIQFDTWQVLKKFDFQLRLPSTVDWLEETN